MRIAVNSCLALTHYGNHLNYLFPKELERDRQLASEDSERGRRARARIKLAVQVASFSQEVCLHRVSSRVRHDGGPTGSSKPCHWRSGHWAMQERQGDFERVVLEFLSRDASTREETR